MADFWYTWTSVLKLTTQLITINNTSKHILLHSSTLLRFNQFDQDFDKIFRIQPKANESDMDKSSPFSANEDFLPMEVFVSVECDAEPLLDHSKRAHKQM